MNFFYRIHRLRDTLLLTLLLLGIGSLVLFLSSQHFVRWDMTEDGRYSLSEATKTLARDIDDLIVVRIYFSQKLPPNLSAVRGQVIDLFEDLAAYSKGKVQVKVLNPGIPQVAEEAKALGIPMVRMNILEKDKVEVKNGFLGIAVSYGPQTEILPVVDQADSLEYDLLVALKKLIKPQQAVIGLVLDEAQKGDYETLTSSLKQFYEVRELAPNGDWDLESVSALIVLSPRQSLSSDTLSTLKAWVETHPLLMFVDPYLVDESLKARRNVLGLDDFLANYGVRFDSGFVMNPTNVETQFKQGNTEVLLPYPFWVKILSSDLDRQSPIVSRLPSLVLPWTTPLILEVTTAVEPLTLARSEAGALIQNEPFDLHPTSSGSKSLGARSLAVLLNLEGQGSLLLVPNARFLNDTMVEQFRENLVFAMNAVDHLTQDDGLISLRSSVLKNYPIANLSDRQRHVVKWLGTFLMPLLVVGYGIARAIHRKHRSNSKSLT